MAIVTTGAGVNLDAANEGPSYMWQFLSMLRTNTDWVLAGSGDGAASGGMGVDAIDSQAKLQTSTSWFVFEDPDGTIQLLFSRNAANDLLWSIYVNPFADYAGGNATTNPTSAGGHTQMSSTSAILGAGTLRFHMLAGDGATTATAGWAVYCHAQGNFGSVNSSMGFIPLDVPATSDARPYIFFLGFTSTNCWLYSNINNAASAINSTRCVGVEPGGTSVQTVPACNYNNLAGTVVPYYAGVDAAGKDVQLPILFLRQSSVATPFFKGISSSWAAYAGVTRSICSTYESETRIDFGGISLPWDGVSIPTVS